MKDITRQYKIDNSIYFNSKFGEKVLSNMYPCRLEYQGEVFKSVEEMFHVLLYRMLIDKTKACKPFRDIILNSGDKDIVEWCYWIYDKRIDTFGTYKDDEKGLFIGGNICGRSMMQVRKEAREGKSLNLKLR